MPPFIGLVSITPGKMNIPGLLNAFHEALQDQADLYDGDLNKTVETWEHEVPEFDVREEASGDSISIVVVPSGDERAVDKWNYLDKGTSIRWAVMSSDWQSKTAPGRLRSGGGSGKAVVRGMRAMQAQGIAPRPGIEPRGWTEMIQNGYKRSFPGLVYKKLSMAANKVFSAVGTIRTTLGV